MQLYYVIFLKIALAKYSFHHLNLKATSTT